MVTDFNQTKLNMCGFGLVWFGSVWIVLLSLFDYSFKLEKFVHIDILYTQTERQTGSQADTWIPREQELLIQFNEKPNGFLCTQLPSRAHARSDGPHKNTHI